MNEAYKKSIIALKDYDKKPSVKEWNELAKKYNLISSKTICYINNLNWNEICNKVRKKLV